MAVKAGMFGLRLLVLSGLMVLCFSGQVRADAPRVVASIKPVHSLAAMVMEGAGTPDLLVNGAANAHAFSLKPSDAKALSEADIVFWIGPVHEQFLEKPLATLAPQAETIAFLEQPDLIILPLPGYPDQQDGHLWMDPRNATAMVRIMARELSRLDEANAALYAENAKSAVQKLSALDLTLDGQLGPIRSKRFVVYHDALRYFVNRYDLDLLGAILRQSEDYLSVRRLAGIRKDIHYLAPICLFAEPGTEEDAIQVVVERTTMKTATIDSEGTMLAPGPDFYFDLMSGVADTLTDCLSDGQR